MTEVQRVKLADLLGKYRYLQIGKASLRDLNGSRDSINTFVERLELEARLGEHKHVCDICNWNNEGNPCDRAKELRAQLEARVVKI